MGCDDGPGTGQLIGPTLLSQTGLYASGGSGALAERVLPVQPRFALWTDGADKERFLWLPPGKRIDASDANQWRFPIGTKLWKHFRFDGQLVETRFLEKRREPDEGGWFQMAYVWNDARTDAQAVPDGAVDAAGTLHDVPEQRACGRCHYRGEKPVVGLSALQLAGSTTLANLVAADAFVGLAPSLVTTPVTIPGDATTQAALGYLHANCSHCHDSRSAAASNVKIFFELHLDETTPEATQTYRSTVNQPIHHFPDVGLTLIVAPGAPDKSLVHYRMARRDDAQMPPVGTEVVDDVGLKTVDDWIRSLQ